MTTPGRRVGEDLDRNAVAYAELVPGSTAARWTSTCSGATRCTPAAPTWSGPWGWSTSSPGPTASWSSTRTTSAKPDRARRRPEGPGASASRRRRQDPAHRHGRGVASGARLTAGCSPSSMWWG